MQKMKSIFMLVLWLNSGNILAQVGQQRVDTEDAASLDAQRERHALQSLLKIAEKEIVSAADAMPADKHGFAPLMANSRARAPSSDGETPICN